MGRLILDNTMVGIDIMHFMKTMKKKETKSVWSSSLILAKHVTILIFLVTCDNIDWDYLRVIMKNMGFFTTTGGVEDNSTC